MFVGSMVIILVGASWFSVLTHTPPLLALRVGVFPFIAGDIVKILLAAAVLPSGWALLRHKASQNK
jgi:biotin transport system substrate-specific component